jgi:hypothetical protein
MDSGCGLKFKMAEFTVTDDVLISYFYSWRSYKEILKRLEQIHGLKRSLTWLKLKFKRLKLRKRPSNALYNDELASNLIKRVLNSSLCLLGYRGIWKVLRDKYKHIVTR